MSQINVFIAPHFSRPDKGDGGIRRVVEAMRKYLPEFDVIPLDTPDGADILNCHGASIVDRPLIPMVASCHGLYWSRYDWPNWGHETNREVVEVLARGVAHTAPSEWVGNAMRRGMLVYPEVIYHGIDWEEWVPGQPEPYVLWNKGRADLVSDPADMQRLAGVAGNVQFVSTLGTPTPNVKVVGTMPVWDMKGLVQNAGIYLATARETFGIGTLEALACGVPVVGWNWGGQSEIIIPGETGYLATPGNYAELQQCLMQAIKEHDRLSANARQDAIDRWGWRQRIAQYADLFHRVYNSHLPTQLKLSIVVTCHDLGKFLPDALNSVKAQPFKEWECLVVDDFSSDNTGEVGKQFAAEDPRFRYLRTPENLKLTGARNFGVYNSKGRYIQFLDADDMLAEDALTPLVEHLDANGGTHIVYGGLDSISEDGSNRQSNPWPWEQFSWRMQLAHLNQIPSCSMMRREVIERVGGYRARDWRAEDASLYCRATSFGFRARRASQGTMLLWRMRGNSKSQQEHKYGEGDWTGWFPWRVTKPAARHINPVTLFGPHTQIPRPDLVPWSADAEPPEGMRFWNVPDFTDPQITVVIPVGPGHERLLIDALDSLVAQDEQNWECIVVNDTGKEWSHDWDSPVAGAPWAKVISTDGPKGASFARNRGAEFARSSVILWLDADDYLLPGALNKMFQTYKKVPGIIYGDWLRSDGDVDVPLTWYESWDFKCGDVLEQMKHSVICLVPLEAHRKIGGFDESMKGWEDWDYLIHLQSIGICSYRVPEPVFVYRFRAGARRETSFANSGELLNHIRTKWAEFYEGRKQMPCGSCPQPVYTPPPVPVVQVGKNGSSKLPTIKGEAVLIAYQGNQTGPLHFRGPKTGAVYKFGSDDFHRHKYVHRDDASFFLSRTFHGQHEFALAGEKDETPTREPVDLMKELVRLHPTFPSMEEVK